MGMKAAIWGSSSASGPMMRFEPPPPDSTTWSASRSLSGGGAGGSLGSGLRSKPDVESELMDEPLDRRRREEDLRRHDYGSALHPTRLASDQSSSERRNDSVSDGLLRC